jgi:magnesium chelatase family protein
MLARIYSAAVQGIDAYPIEIEVNAGENAWGDPQTVVVGLPDAAVKESRDRVKTALENSGFRYPIGRTTVNLAPASTNSSRNSSPSSSSSASWP